MRPERRQRPRLSGQGFTLLEVLVAVMILALSVTAILYQFSVAMEAGSRSRDITEAILHAKEKLEDLKAAVESGAAGGSGTFEDGYSWETTVQPYELAQKEAGENQDMLKFEMLQLTAVVRWDVAGQMRRVELSTLKAVKKKERQ